MEFAFLSVLLSHLQMACFGLFTVRCAMTHSYVPWLIHMCHDSFTCAMTHAFINVCFALVTVVCHDSFICAMAHIWICVCFAQFTVRCAMTRLFVPWLIQWLVCASSPFITPQDGMFRLFDRDVYAPYSQLQIGWHRISKFFSKLFKRTTILPMGYAICNK